MSWFEGQALYVVHVLVIVPHFFMFSEPLLHVSRLSERLEEHVFM